MIHPVLPLPAGMASAAAGGGGDSATRTPSDGRRIDHPAILAAINCAAPGGLGYIDLEGRVGYLNPYLAQFHGGGIDDQVGRPLAELLPALWPQIAPHGRAAIASDTAIRDVPASGPTADDPGRTRHWLTSYYPVSVDGKVAGVGVVVVDMTERIQSDEALLRLTHATVTAIAATVDARDPYTAGHQRRVAEIASAIATRMGLTEHEVEGITLGAHIHDIGKVTIPSEILTRPGRLQGPEWTMVQGHQKAGYDIVSGIAFPWPIAEMILQHHERLDGSGYPDGLRGDNILPAARIIAVADVAEAMSAHRPYRPALGLSAALGEVRRGRGLQFDAEVVGALLDLDRCGLLRIDGPGWPQGLRAILPDGRADLVAG